MYPPAANPLPDTDRQIFAKNGAQLWFISLFSVTSASTSAPCFQNISSNAVSFLFLGSSILSLATYLEILSSLKVYNGCTNPSSSSIKLEDLRYITHCELFTTAVHIVCCCPFRCSSVYIFVTYIRVAHLLGYLWYAFLIWTLDCSLADAYIFDTSLNLLI